MASPTVTNSVGEDFIRTTSAVGGEYVAVVSSYTNISSAPVEAWNAPRLKLVDPAGHIYGADLGASAAFAAQINASAKALSNVNPGITISDGDVFEVSQALFDPKTWTLRVSSQDGDALVSLMEPARSWIAAAARASAPKSPASQNTGASVPDQAASASAAEGQDVALAGTVLVGHDSLASGAYTYVHTDAPITSPCDGSKVQDILLWSASVGDPLMLKIFAGQHVILHGTINCPTSGIQFAPDSANRP